MFEACLPSFGAILVLTMPISGTDQHRSAIASWVTLSDAKDRGMVQLHRCSASVTGTILGYRRAQDAQATKATKATDMS